MLDAKLVLIGGDTNVNEIELRLPAMFGRGRDSTVSLPYPLVSRRHCEIFEENGKLAVRDLGSLNGTFVGCQRINQAELNHGDLLTIGTLTFRAIYRDFISTEPPITSATPKTNPSETDTVRMDDSQAMVESWAGHSSIEINE